MIKVISFSTQQLKWDFYFPPVELATKTNAIFVNIYQYSNTGVIENSD